MNNRVEEIKLNIELLKQKITNHKVYSAIKNIDDLKIFMKYHVFAVWDFMSLLKSLQSSLTCTTIPWFPVGNAETRFLINEIVVGEESDIDNEGVRKSHFEMYIDAMKQCFADTNYIETFINELNSSNDLNLAFKKSNTPQEAIDFVNFTFRIINSKKAHLQAAIFTFGREDLIPQMFLSMINELHKNFPNNIAKFKYYIERHIEVDGEHHSQLAIQMTENLCENKDDLWNEAEAAIKESLEHRIKLWDGIYNEIKKSEKILEMQN